MIFADDLGWGDLGCYGHPTIRTPHLDRMAAEGAVHAVLRRRMRVHAEPRRPAHGRLPIRSGMCSDTRRVLFPNSAGGLPDEEITLAEALHDVGYATACFGKWHLGHLPQYLPNRNGFDEYLGLPYSNDMDRVPKLGPQGRGAFDDPKIEYWNVPLIRGTEVIERPADQSTLARRFTEAAIRFIRAPRPAVLCLCAAYDGPRAIVPLSGVRRPQHAPGCTATASRRSIGPSVRFWTRSAS
ncbi:MAG: sulfatase-like hydrolase/transferase [Planctomycetaceae bacterium]